MTLGARALKFWQLALTYESKQLHRFLLDNAVRALLGFENDDLKSLLYVLTSSSKKTQEAALISCFRVLFPSG